MDDDQLLFWYTKGRSVKTEKPNRGQENAVTWNRNLTAEENVKRFKAASEKRDPKNGKNR